MTTKPTIAVTCVPMSARVLTAALVCLAAALVFICTPMGEYARFAPSMAAASTQGGAADQDSQPAAPKRLHFIAEWRAIKAAASHDDGKTKVAFAAAGLKHPDFVLGEALPYSVLRPVSPERAHGARAPPAFS